VTALAVMRMLRTWTLDREAGARAATATVDDLVAEYGLGEDEAKAVVDHRLDWLSEYGVHPVSLVQLARARGFAVSQRWAQLAGPEESS
jgi:hypothetical protein